MDYWQKRQEAMYKAGEMQVNKYFTRLEKAFNQTRRELQKTIEAFYFRYAEENGLTFAAAQKKLDAEELGELRDFIDLAMQNIGRYNQKVNNMSLKFRMTYYQALEIQIDILLRQLYAIDYQAEAEKTMQEVYEDTYCRTWYNADQYHGFHTGFAQINPTVVEKLLEYPFNGAVFSDRLWKQKDHLQAQLMEAVTTMLIQGKHPSTLTKEFAKKMNSKKFDAYRLIHTESSFLMSEARHAGYRERGVKKYKILATLDSKTCGICGELDGNVYEVGKEVVGVNMPPFHPLCRCTDTPYYDDMDLTDMTRAARDPETGKTYEVPGDMSYPEWKKRFLNVEKLQGNRNKKLKSSPIHDNIVDIKFKSQKSNAEVREDKKTVVEAYAALPPKVQRVMSDVTVDLGNPGSACDFENGIIYTALNAEKEDIYHEFGHLVEYRMVHPADVEAYKQYLVEGLSRADISQETYYNTAGEPVEIFIIHGPRFVSEYQGRLYVDRLEAALNPDGSIRTDSMLETISEPFRMYQIDKKTLDDHEEILDFIERIIK